MTVLGGLQCLADAFEDAELDVVSIPMTVLGGLQSEWIDWMNKQVARFNTDDGIRRAAIIEVQAHEQPAISFNTDDGIRRAAIGRA